MREFELLKKNDPELFDAVCKETARQRNKIELIASENFVSELELVSDAAKLLHPSLALGDSVFYCVLAVHMLLSYSEIKIFPESSAQRCETTRLTPPFGCTRATNRLDWLLTVREPSSSTR